MVENADLTGRDNTSLCGKSESLSESGIQWQDRTI